MTELDIPMQTIVPKLDEQSIGKKIMDAFRARQVLAGDITDNNDVAYEYATQPEGPIMDKAGEHNVAAMYVADTLAEALELNDLEASYVRQAALLHDSGKKTEVTWIKHLESTNPKDKTKRANKARNVLESLANMEDAENTLDLGIDPEVSKLMHANVPPTDREQTLPEKTMWFSDAVLQAINRDGVLRQNLVTVKTRFDELEKNPRSIEFSNLFNPLYGRPLFDVQRELGATYEQEFARKLNMTVDGFYRWLQGQVQQKIQKGYIPTL